MRWIQIPVKYEWILFLDADEVVTPAFQKALTDAVGQARR